MVKMDINMKNKREIAAGILIFIMAAGTLHAGDLNKHKSVSVSFKSILLNEQNNATSPEQIIRRRPSKAKAFFLSLALPGMGQLYAGNLKSAKIFWGTEALAWITYGSFRWYGSQKRSDYRAFAAAHAGVSSLGKNHDYFVAVENYMSLRDYNNAKLKQRNIDAMYPENGEYSWEWDKEESRKKFESLRVSSDKAFDRAVIVVGCVVINHIISAIDGQIEARKKSGENIVGVAGLPQGGGVVFFVKSF